ncbi:hypothetical protein RJ640_002997 [Escallonia rubra]|uniref:EF-hand domain-containing protein n=1 Tax=Escallonia rubra TaxID=112253 RepID=A0AA88UGJ4_9ASTE|nr:hypothetical protein RJ640_002997 [Escallonia rubra]
MRVSRTEMPITKVIGRSGRQRDRTSSGYRNGTQLEKLNSKIKHLGDLELIMEKEHAQREELEESLQAERMNVLQRVLNAGLSRWRDHTSAGQAMCFNGTTSGVSTSDRTAEDSVVPMSRVSAEANQSSAGPNPPSAAPVHRESAERNPSSAAPIHREVAEPSPSYAASSAREMDEHNQHNASSSSAVLEVDDIHMAEAVEHLSALTGDLGTPFTYLASLSADSLIDEITNEPGLRDIRVTFEEFKNFAELRKRLLPLSMAIFSHGKVNGLLTKQDFQRAAYHVCGISLTDNVVDMIFYMFDENRDGNLSSDEFFKSFTKTRRGHFTAKGSQGMQVFKKFFFFKDISMTMVITASR